MAKKNTINIVCFGQEIGRLGFDENLNISFFQYNPDYLSTGVYKNLFPETGIIKRIKTVQVFKDYNSETFRGLPPMIADSLPDMFGNIIFKKWLENANKDFKKITVIEQLAYVANRGMGALEFKPSKEISGASRIDIDEIVEVLKNVLELKEHTQAHSLNNEALLNVFKIGSSAGGARPKILISEHKKTGDILPGDINYSAEYNHYLVKLSIEDNLGYNREAIEYSYYLTATQLGIRMSESKLIDNKHFATKRFDRINGQKKHVLTASGITGWDFKNAEVSSYENLFELALFLKVPHTEIEELFKRMVFNLIFCNTDDHLKNHSFMYNEMEDKWNLSPAYDITYSLNPLVNYKRISRALSVNNKRVDINLSDVLTIAEKFTIKNAERIIYKTHEAQLFWKQKAIDLQLPLNIINSIEKDFHPLIKSNN